MKVTSSCIVVKGRVVSQNIPSKAFQYIFLHLSEMKENKWLVGKSQSSESEQTSNLTQTSEKSIIRSYLMPDSAGTSLPYTWSSLDSKGQPGMDEDNKREREKKKAIAVNFRSLKTIMYNLPLDFTYCSGWRVMMHH